MTKVRKYSFSQRVTFWEQYFYEVVASLSVNRFKSKLHNDIRFAPVCYSNSVTKRRQDTGDKTEHKTGLRVADLMSQSTGFLTRLQVHVAKTQISLCIRAV